jgi:hypothetical protein
MFSSAFPYIISNYNNVFLMISPDVKSGFISFFNVTYYVNLWTAPTGRVPSSLGSTQGYAAQEYR